MLYSLRNDKILLEEKDFIRLQSSNMPLSSKSSERIIEEMSLFQNSMVSKLREVFVFSEIGLSYIFMALLIENILTSEDINISNMECLNEHETMVLNFVISWDELQQVFQSIHLLEWVNLKSRSEEWSQNFMALLI